MREPLEESGGMLPRTILKSRVLEMLYSAFSMSYFLFSVLTPDIAEIFRT